jgi:hypothetical protein
MPTRSSSLKSFMKSYKGPNPSVVHIIPSDNTWRVKREGTLKASAVKTTKQSAISRACQMRGVDRVVVHNKDGTFKNHIK